MHLGFGGRLPAEQQRTNHIRAVDLSHSFRDVVSVFMSYVFLFVYFHMVYMLFLPVLLHIL